MLVRQCTVLQVVRVDGHTGVPGNELVDAVAKDGARGLWPEEEAVDVSLSRYLDSRIGQEWAWVVEASAQCKEAWPPLVGRTLSGWCPVNKVSVAPFAQRPATDAVPSAIKLALATANVLTFAGALVRRDREPGPKMVARVAVVEQMCRDALITSMGVQEARGTEPGMTR
jgi:hypothetical protein